MISAVLGWYRLYCCRIPGSVTLHCMVMLCMSHGQVTSECCVYRSLVFDIYHPNSSCSWPNVYMCIECQYIKDNLT